MSWWPYHQARKLISILSAVREIDLCAGRGIGGGREREIGRERERERDLRRILTQGPRERERERERDLWRKLTRLEVHMENGEVVFFSFPSLLLWPTHSSSRTKLHACEFFLKIYKTMDSLFWSIPAYGQISLSLPPCLPPSLSLNLPLGFSVFPFLNVHTPRKIPPTSWNHPIIVLTHNSFIKPQGMTPTAFYAPLVSSSSTYHPLDKPLFIFL